MYSLNNANLQSYNTIQFRSTLAKWTSEEAIMQSNPGQVGTFLFFMKPPCCFFALYKRTTATKIVYFSKICCRTQIKDPVLSGTSVSPTSQVHTSAVLVLPIVGN
jgi:hypothetical protein